jgi:GNAT superfamily N-acetyltransferase
MSIPTAVFHQVDPPGREPGVCWIASLYEHGDNPPYPMAMAWLSDYRSCPVLGVVLDFILVPDQFRRRGYATQLIAACRDRFGADIQLTDAISPEGECLLASIPDDTGGGVQP